MIVLLKKKLVKKLCTMIMFVGKNMEKSKRFTRKDVIQFEFEQIYQFTFFPEIRFLLNFIT